MKVTTTLPIEPILPMLLQALRASRKAVLVAPPGAGKTTRVPLALLGEAWLQNQRILMLEPRRLAARAAATFMAQSLGESVGRTIGYRVRYDTQVSVHTRIEVVTEGVLTRMLQSDPELQPYGIVIFDEFHERNLQSDLGLALCLECQELRDDLALLVMSATLDAAPVAALLGDAPVITSEGSSFPVETIYLERSIGDQVERAVVDAILDALVHHQGDILTFLPGAAEIRRVAEMLRSRNLPSGVKVVPLHGNLPLEMQTLALVPSAADSRKVVLSTSIAETSLTVAGVRVVIDSGLSRVQRFSPRTGMTRLETVSVAQDTANQRRGRAGRLGSGICYRLWTQAEQQRLPPHSNPEILTADLTSLALELAMWGVTHPAELRWLDAPPTSAYAQAKELLTQLGAITANAKITSHGQAMAKLGVHPRLAHMVLTAIPLTLSRTACLLAALLSERDVLHQAGHHSVDVQIRMEALMQVHQDTSSVSPTSGPVVNIDACRRILSAAARLAQTLGLNEDEPINAHATGLLLALAYPDRIAQRREPGRFLLRNGRGAYLHQDQPLAHSPFLVAAELDDKGTDSRALLAAEIDLETLRQHFSDQIEEEAVVAWDSSAQAVRSRKYERLGALTFGEAQQFDTDIEEIKAALLAGIETEGLAILPWTRTARQLQARIHFMHHLMPGWPEASDEALLQNLDVVVGPYLYGRKSRADLQALDLSQILTAMLTWQQRQELDAEAPTHLTVPSGSRIPIDYGNPEAPSVSVRLQEVFGLHETPRIAHGKVALTMHLLSPAQRPVQITRDLASFWRDAYFEVRKDLKGRYPKHFWPDDPLCATPTNRVRRS